VYCIGELVVECEVQKRERERRKTSLA